LTDDSGNVVETYEYDVWGNTRVFDASGTELSESAYGNRFCFQGREIDWDTGLYYFRARWCDPGTGRWLSKDPIGISGGLNQYVAFGNNPVNFVDPTGLDYSITEPDVGSAGLTGLLTGTGAIGGGFVGAAFGFALSMVIIKVGDLVDIYRNDDDDDDGGGGGGGGGGDC